MNNLIGISGKIGSGKDTVGKIINYLIAQKKYSNKIQCSFEEFVLTGETKVAFENPKFEIKKFADKLKDIVCLILGCTREQLEDREFKEKELGEEWVKYRIITKGLPNYYVSTLEEAENNVRHTNQRYVKVVMTPRKLLQLLGTDCGRNIIHRNIWSISLFTDYSKGSICNCIQYEESDGCYHCDYSGYDSMPSNWIITDMRFPNELKAVKDRGGVTIRVNRKTNSKFLNKKRAESTIKNGFEHPSETALDNAEFDYVIDNNGTIEDLVEKVKNILTELKLI